MKPRQAPLRVDFAGGGLDCADHAIEGAFIVNCAIQPMVSPTHWPYETNSGLGGGAAYSILTGSTDPSLGWQDRAVILETGLCVWRSGPAPVLDSKVNPDWLSGLMALWHSGQRADEAVQPVRSHALAKASQIAAQGVQEASLSKLADAINQTHSAQLEAGMAPVPSALHSLAYKYAGRGFGGYVLYLFGSRGDRDRFCSTGGLAIEPYLETTLSPQGF